MGGQLAKYYTRPRKVQDPKKWLGPFDISQLQDQAKRRLFSKELDEYSEDRVNWMSARQIWPTLFPKKPPVILKPQFGIPVAQPVEVTEPEDSAQLLTEFVEESGEWYCACDGVQHGPFTATQLQELVTRGQLQPEDLIWNPLLGDQWVEARTDPNLFPATKIDLKQSNQPTNRNQQTPPLAIASFTLGLLGTCCLPVVGSILGIIFGHICLGRMRNPQYPQKGKWMAIVGVSVGYTMLAILVIAMFVYLAVT